MQDKSLIEILVWPDHSWCEPEDLTEDQGDDYMILDVPADVDDIDEWLNETRPQDPAGD